MAFECVYFPKQFYCLHSEFSVCVPAIQNSISVARSVALERCHITPRTWGYNNFFFSLSYILLHKIFVYIVYMESFITDWDSLKHWHLPFINDCWHENKCYCWGPVKDRKIKIFAHKTIYFMGKETLHRHIKVRDLFSISITNSRIYVYAQVIIRVF